MLTEIFIRDFQSIAEADLELGPFTVIVGDGNTGKTAVLRAIKALALNRTGTDFIRHGRSESAVAITTDDGHTVVWVKDKTTAKYVVDGQELTKLAGGVPDEVQDALKVRRIELEGSSYTFPQFHSQFDAPFLLDESATKSARSLAKLTRLDVIVSAQVAALRDLKRRSGALRDMERRLVDLSVEQTEIEAGAAAASAAASEVKELHEKALALTVKVELAESLIETLRSTELAAQAEVPSPADLSNLETQIDNLVAAARLAKDVEELDKKLDYFEQEQQRVEAEKVEAERRLAAIKVCPICGSRLGGTDAKRSR